MKFTIGFSTRNDEGAWWTTELLLEYHSHLFRDGYGEIVIVDDSPKDSPYARDLAAVVETYKSVRYIRAVGPESSCLYKERLFQEARGEIVMCCDSHVFFPLGAIDAVIDYLDEDQNALNLVMGMCKKGASGRMGSNQVLYSTEPYDLSKVGKKPDVIQGVVMRGGSAGVWVVDPRATDESGPAFEIMQQGTGAFAMRRESWPGFHPSFLGHGGNETYLMERVRENGGCVMSLPQFKWTHRFYRPGGPPYEVRWPPKVKNYLTTAIELRRSDLYDAFVGHFEKRCSGTLAAVLSSGEYPRPSGQYERFVKALSAGADSEHDSPRPLLEFIRRFVKPKMRTVEFNCGVSTLCFAERRANHDAVCYRHFDLAKTSDALDSADLSIRQVCATRQEDGWYDRMDVVWNGDAYDMILINGPRLNMLKMDACLGCPRTIGHLLRRPNGVLVVDNTHRVAESKLSVEIARECGLSRKRLAHGKRSFDLLRQGS